MHTTTADPNEQHVVNFVPDEVCVVTATNRIDDVSAFYERVRTQLNQQITALLQASASGDRPDTTGPLGPDLRGTPRSRGSPLLVDRGRATWRLAAAASPTTIGWVVLES